MNNLLMYYFLLGCLLNGLVDGKDLQNNGLFFNLNGETYCDGDTVLIEDIGEDVYPRGEYPGSALVCNTSYVNTKCCRKIDNDNNRAMGDWLYSNKCHVIKNNNNTINNIFVHINFLKQVRLVKKGNVTGPLGNYTCQVPDMNGEMQSAKIHITSKAKSDATVSTPMQCTSAISTESISLNSKSTEGEFGHDVMPSSNNSASDHITRIPSTNTANITIIASLVAVFTVAITILIVIVLLIRLQTRFCPTATLKCHNYFSACTTFFNKHNENIPATLSQINDFDSFSTIDSERDNSDGIHNVPYEEDVSNTYSVVDKSKKKTKRVQDEEYSKSNIDKMYASVDKQAKRKEKSRESAGNGPSINDLYAVVDKRAKRKPTGKAADTTSSNISEMYAIVDKKCVTNKTSKEELKCDKNF